ncbi:hypothetical protein VIGAN_01309000 [Vigna angularis var. angularis]|uniref:Uncharacterized protein n=1 Tax=Vigna angularis var. angularis TaxID=157739 RepID=A0A0S3R3G6_PHAAN|nr:hypothetical protein VIGAN_01309000 [Vigna angularis var. angularis]
MSWYVVLDLNCECRERIARLLVILLNSSGFFDVGEMCLLCACEGVCWLWCDLVQFSAFFETSIQIIFQKVIYC